jgi:putative ABC transport system ATP-binding protein
MPDPRPDHAAVVAAAGLVKTYTTGSRQVTALRGVDLDVTAGEWISIMGPSGCGKSTLLHLLGGLDTPDHGSVHIAGRDVAGGTESQRAVLRRALVGYVFQAANLVPDLSVAENLELPAQLAGAGRRAAHQRTRELLEQLGLGHTLGAAPTELSGGEQQRVALARALVNRPPPLLLADEPTGALDTDSARTVLALLRRMHHDGQTIVLVTHDHRVAAAADRVLVMQDGAIGDERRLAEAGAGSLLAQLPPLEVS